VTGFNTSSYSGLPCAEVLSVAGFLAFMVGFPLGERVISGQDYLLNNLGFLTLLTVLDGYSCSVRRCPVLNIVTFMRKQAAQCGSVSNPSSMCTVVPREQQPWEIKDGKRNTHHGQEGGVPPWDHQRE